MSAQRTAAHWVPDAAAGAWRALTVALRTVPLPCQGDDADAWYSDDLRRRQLAAQACSGCLLISECREYARTADERFGVWAGVDRSYRPGGRRADTTRPPAPADHERNHE